MDNCRTFYLYWPPNSNSGIFSSWRRVCMTASASAMACHQVQHCGPRIWANFWSKAGCNESGWGKKSRAGHCPVRMSCTFLLPVTLCFGSGWIHIFYSHGHISVLANKTTSMDNFIDGISKALFKSKNKVRFPITSIS